MDSAANSEALGASPEIAGKHQSMDKLVITSDECSDESDENLDVVHVKALSADDEGLSFKHSHEPFRHMHYQCDVPSLLAGSLVQQAIETQAAQLLRELAVARKRAPDRPIIFIAYDIGSLVVKTAVAFVMTREKEFPGFFLKIIRVVFVGCPHRAHSSQGMESKMMELLCCSGKRATGSYLPITATTIRYLARAVQEATHAFINSKIAFVCRIISVYAAADPKILSSALDFFTATVGTPKETCISEDTIGKKMGLNDALRLQSECEFREILTTKPKYFSLAKTLLSISASRLQSQYESTRDSPLSILPLVGTKEYLQWEGAMGPSILYLYGSETSRDRIEYISSLVPAVWKARTKKREEIDLSYVESHFIFDSADSSRNTITSMMATLFLDWLSDADQFGVRKCCHILEDLFHFRGGWAKTSSLALLDGLCHRYFFLRCIMVWHYQDDCTAEDRQVLLDYLSKLASLSEMPQRIVMTSRKPSALLSQLQKTGPDVRVVSIDIDKLFGYSKDSDKTEEWIDALLQQCPTDDDKQRIQQGLDRLSTSAAYTAKVQTVVTLLRNHTGWPQDPSQESLVHFGTLLHRVGPGDTPSQVLDALLRSEIEEDKSGCFRWVLAWLLCSFRPLTLPELSVLCHYFWNSKDGRCLINMPALSLIQRASEQLEIWLRVLVDFRQSQVKLRDDVRGLLVENGSSERTYIWNDIRETAHDILAEFCLSQLAADETIHFLDKMVQDYMQELLHPSPVAFTPVTPPITPDFKCPVFYVVQALTYHLGKCSKNISSNILELLVQDPKSPSSYWTLWAKANWAMDNPFSRGINPPETALAVLIGQGLVSFDRVECILKGQPNETRDSLGMQCLVAVSGTGRRGVARKLLSYANHADYTMTFLEEALLCSIQAANEGLALDIVHKMLSVSSGIDDPSTLWPESLVWAAAWLDMSLLAEKLLTNGASPDPHTVRGLPMKWKSHPSPLYLAICLRRTKVVRLLLEHNARTDSPLPDDLDGYLVAAKSGDPDILRAYLDHGVPLMTAWNKLNALFYSATYGNWKYTEALLDAGMDANSESRGWTPLERSCRFGYAKTVQKLLEREADPNKTVFMSPPLQTSASMSPSIECTQLLLEYGADPNQEYWKKFPVLYRGKKSYEFVLPVWDLLYDNDPPVDINLQNLLYHCRTPLILACGDDGLLGVTWLLERGADVDAVDLDNKSALHYAVESSSSERLAIVDKLLACDPKPNLETACEPDGLTALHMAVENPEMVRRLLDAGANPEAETSAGLTLINLAVAQSVTEVVKMLVERKGEDAVDLNHRNAKGWAPICDAMTYAYSPEIVRLLAEGGAALHHVSPPDGLPLLSLAICKPPEIMRILLEFRRSLDTEERDKHGDTPLLSVRRRGDIDSFRLLIQAGANLNAENDRGETPLINVVIMGHSDYIYRLLEEPEVDVNHLSTSGTALHCACFRNNVDVVFHLLDKGADPNISCKCTLRSTPLFATLLSARYVYRPEMRASRVDQVVRILVSRGADIHHLASSHTVHNALTAACLGSGNTSQIIKFLLNEGASPEVAHPATGVLPLHFAAASGLQSFTTIMLAYRGDMMVPDLRGKTCLHWAAEFGNAKTVKHILDSVSSSGKSTTDIINSPDKDGWTPLSWAMRCLDPDDWLWGHRAEKMDFAETVRLLVDHGADRTWTCRWYPVEGSEQISMLEMALLCDAPDKVLSLVAYGRERRDEKKITRSLLTYQKSHCFCNICLARVFGLVYRCSICSSFEICTKCYASVDTIHNGDIIGDGKMHMMKDNGIKEFNPISPLSTPEREPAEGGFPFDDLDDEDLGDLPLSMG